MKLKEGFILRQVVGQNVVMPASADLDLNCMITLNETAAVLWKRLEQEAELEDLVSALKAEFDVHEATALSAAKAFVEKLKEHDFLV